MTFLVRRVKQQGSGKPKGFLGSGPQDASEAACLPSQALEKAVAELRLSVEMLTTPSH